MQDVWEPRRRWYTDILFQKIEDQFNRGLSQYSDNALDTDAYFRVAVVHEDGAPRVPSDLTTIHQSRLGDQTHPKLSKIGFDLPLPIVVHSSPNSGKEYAMVPWNGVLACLGCGRKIEDSVVPICKHEIHALLAEHEGDFTDTVSRLTPRFRRLVAPSMYVGHTPKTPQEVRNSTDASLPFLANSQP